MPPPANWQPAVSAPPLATGTIHVWRVATRPTPQQQAALLARLAPDEQARAHRYLVEPPRQQFVVVRAVLRLLLAEYLRCTTPQISFTVSAHGKPALASDPSLHFNVAHSHGIGLLAFSRTAPVGVDVEQERADVAVLDLAQRFFDPSEAAALHACAPTIQRSAFFACWTHKEACLKAAGSTLAAGLQQFVLQVQPPQPPILRATPPDHPPPAAWTLAPLLGEAGSHAAVASPSENLLIHCLQRNLDSIL